MSRISQFSGSSLLSGHCRCLGAGVVSTTTGKPERHAAPALQHGGADGPSPGTADLGDSQGLCYDPLAVRKVCRIPDQLQSKSVGISTLPILNAIKVFSMECSSEGRGMETGRVSCLSPSRNCTTLE